MATLTGNLADVTNKTPENISSITVKAPAARIGGSGGSSVIVTSPATVDFNSSTGDITISNLTGGLSWLYIEGDGWADSIGLAVADGMVTLVEAVANALGMPGIVDYIRLLADLEGRIEDVAQGAVDAAAENIKWTKRDLATGEDLNTVIEPGLYTIPSYTLAMSLVNRPPNDAIQSATLRVTESGGGAIKQRWERLGLASHRLVTMERSRDSTNTWSAWELVPDAETVKAADWFKGVIPDGANLDTYQTPGEYEIPSYNAARSLTGRPDGLIQRAMLKVRVAGGTAMHELTEWTSSGVRVWKRETAGGVWRAWREGEEEDIPNTPLQTVYMWGDSAVAGGDTNGSWAAGENLPGRIGALLDTPVESRGVSGHTANTTLIRAGVLEIWATGTIPAGTGEASINVAGLDIDLRVRRTFAATWDGIAGTLAIDGDNFTFKRSSAGTAQTITTPKRVILDTAVPLGEGTHIFLMGGNDWLSDAGTAPEANKELHLVESYRRAVEAVPGDPLKKVLIGGLKTRRSTVVGDENYRIVRAVNQQLRKMYPGIFVDRQAWLSSRGLAAAGISPTSADNAAMAAGLVPPSAFATGDDTHIRKEVVQAEAAELWANALVRKGWARLKSGTSLPAMVDTFAGDLSASLPPAFSSTGSPEGKVAAPVGSIYTDTAATNGAIRWIKVSGTGSTGWRDDYGDTIAALETKADKSELAAKADKSELFHRGRIPSGISPNEMMGSAWEGLWEYTSAQAPDWNLPSRAAGFLTVSVNGFSTLHEITVLHTPIDTYRKRAYNGSWLGDWEKLGGNETPPPDPTPSLPELNEYEVSASRTAINALVPNTVDPTLTYEADRASLLAGLKTRLGPISTGGKAALALVADHGTTAFKEWVWDEAKARNIPFTLALSPEIHLDGKGDSRHTASNDDIKQWISEGLCIASHSSDHGGARGYFDVHRQIVTSKLKLEEKLETPVDAWVQTGYNLAEGNYDGFGSGQSASRYTDYYAGRLLQQTYPVITGYVGTDWVYPASQDLPVGAGRSFTERKDNYQNVQDSIQRAIDTGSKHINFLHPYALPTSSNTYITKSEYLAFLDWIVTKRDAGELALLTLPELAICRP